MARSSALGVGEVSSHRRDSNAAEGRYTPAAATHGIAQEKKKSHLRFCGIGGFLGAKTRLQKKKKQVMWCGAWIDSKRERPTLWVDGSDRYPGYRVSITLYGFST